MQIEVYCQTDIGLRRERNEDSFLVDESLGLYLVADGMGGHRGGEVASSMAVQTVRDYIFKAQSDKRKPSPRQLLADSYREASAKIWDHSHNKDPELEGMGTTLVSAYWNNRTLYIANVGDSRAYLFSKSKLWQMTEDHSYVNEQVRAGLLAEKDIEKFGAKNVITRSVGFEKDVVCDIVERSLLPGDLVLMCSDGLSGLVEDKRIAEICAEGDLKNIVSKCISEAKANGGDDNVTVLALRAQT